MGQRGPVLGASQPRALADAQSPAGEHLTVSQRSPQPRPNPFTGLVPPAGLGLRGAAPATAQGPWDSGGFGDPNASGERQDDNREPLMELAVSVLNNSSSWQLRGAGLIPELLI